jgi:hypothetical protein
MATKASVKQSLHDKVVHEREKAWRADDRVLTVYMNPGQERNASYPVDGEELYPDLIVEHRDYGWFIEEVETEESVDEHELIRWLKFARADLELNLVVPERSLSKAQALIGDTPNIYLRTYSVSGQDVTFS